MDTWLVTGGSGFIGSNFIRYILQKEPIKIINLDKLTYAGCPLSLTDLQTNLNYTFIHDDISNRQTVHSIFQNYQPSVLINFAAESHVDRSITNPDSFITTNIFGTYSLLEEARFYWQNLDQIKRSRFRFLQISTDEVYGSLKMDEPPFREESSYAPNSPYSASKASGDHLVRSYNRTFGLPTLITHCSNNYGPYQFPEKLIPLMILNGLNGKPLPIYGNGENIRDWIYVADHCEALLQVIKRGRPGETYNIGGNCEISNLEVVHSICDLLDEFFPNSPFKPHQSLITFVTDRPGHDLRYAIDSSKIEHELGFKPSVSFATGLKKTLQWYLEHSDWVQMVQSGEYQDWIHQNYDNREKGEHK